MASSWFAAKPDAKAQAREQKREMKKGEREIQREIQATERREQQLVRMAGIAETPGWRRRRM
jgi:hypothetical protein